MKNIFVFIMSIVWLIPVKAQVDTAALFNNFLQVSGAYSQAPVNVKFNIKQTNNFIRSAADTASANGYINMPEAGKMYMNVYPFEQLIEDSIGLIIQHQQQRIYKVTDTSALRKQLNSYTSNRLKESNVTDLMNHYEIVSSGENDFFLLTLTLKDKLPKINLSAVEIKLIYSQSSLKPVSIEHITRRLIHINDSDTSTFLNTYEREYLLPVQNGEARTWYFIHNTSVKISYTETDSMEFPRMPLNAYIQKDENGEWVPLERFRNYQIVVY